ncbi:nitronate monooxygenase family protein [Paenibacillus sp. J31TS4]|uniref:NAD(P)H-dependent flavin oxidoreductase n=1 Tax=Paenibacillus sp. J31TS4 TaxID=2807195 RepID=UPI001BCC57C8|nr:nitronate monooxygenase [Paenibacillus sp. J31TS4]
MWSTTPLTELLSIRYPLIQAGMAGGTTTPELVAAVSRAGGLGTLGAGYLTPDAIRTAIRSIREQTDRPFAVNLFIPEPYSVDDTQIADTQRRMAGIRAKLGLPEPQLPAAFAESYDAQLAVVLEERVPVFSFTFGLPAPEELAELKRLGIVTIGTATTTAEAVQLEQAGVDAITAQGSEAGGHRGTFAGPHGEALVGTMALVPQAADAVRVPVIAAGGIMDGRGVAAALALGAAGAQLGSAFLACDESGAHPQHKAAVRAAADSGTSLTRAFSGKPARGVRNAFMAELDPAADTLPPYPVQNALTRDIRQAAAKRDEPAYLSLWAGQAAGLARTGRAEAIVEALVRETEAVLGRLR